MPSDLTQVGAGIRIEQQLVGIEAVSRRRLIWPVNPEAVRCAGAHTGKVAMPDLIGVFRQRDALQLAVAFRVENADFHLGRIRRKYGEIGSASIPGGTARMRMAFSDAISQTPLF